MHIAVQSCTLVSATTLLMIGLVLLIYGTGNELKWPPVAWGLADILHAVVTLMISLEGYATSPGLIILANVMDLSAIALLWSGTACFMGERRPAWVCFSPVLITLIAYPALHYGYPSQPMRIVIAAALATCGLVDSGRLLLRDKHSPTVLLGWVLIGVGVAQAARAAVALSTMQVAQPVPTAIQVDVNGLATLAVFVFWSVGMLMASADRSQRELRALLEQHRAASLTDQLTGLANRRSLQARMEQEIALADRHGMAFSLLFIDFDNFKQINDTWGHHCGDLVLQRGAEALQRALRKGDVLARWGGEEFVVLAPHTSCTAALHLADRLRESVSSLVIPYGEETFRFTVTIGVAAWAPGMTFTDLLSNADQALYRGKQGGRNQVVLG